MKILVTGAAGYIGSVLVPMLLQRGHEVITLDNFMYGQLAFPDCSYHKSLVVIRGDARDGDLIIDIFKKYQLVDYIIPLAAIVGADACKNDPIAAQTTNEDAIKHLLTQPKSGIIFPNTNSGYGIGQDGIHCTEESPLNPISLYGRTKVAAEKLVLQNPNSIVLRLATVFGVSPRMRTDLLVNDFVRDAVQKRYIRVFEPHFKRNFIHVRDVARAFLHCMENFKNMQNQVYNLGLSSANISKWELCEKIKEYIPEFEFSEGAGEDPDKRNYIVSNKKIERAGFEPAFSLDDGIIELVKIYKAMKRNIHGNA